MRFLKYKRLKLKLRVVLAGHSVAMVTYCVTKIITTCSPVFGQFLIPWLCQLIKNGNYDPSNLRLGKCWKLFWATLNKSEALEPDGSVAAGPYPGFCSMKRLGVFLLPRDEMLVHRRSLSRNFSGFPNNSPVPIYSPGWREALWVLSALAKLEH